MHSTFSVNEAWKCNFPSAQKSQTLKMLKVDYSLINELKFHHEHTPSQFNSQLFDKCFYRHPKDTNNLDFLKLEVHNWYRDRHNNGMRKKEMVYIFTI